MAPMFRKIELVTCHPQFTRREELEPCVAVAVEGDTCDSGTIKIRYRQQNLSREIASSAKQHSKRNGSTMYTFTRL